MIKKYFYNFFFLVFFSVVSFSIGAKTSPVSELNSKDILIKNVFIINGLGAVSYTHLTLPTKA